MTPAPRTTAPRIADPAVRRPRTALLAVLMAVPLALGACSSQTTTGQAESSSPAASVSQSATTSPSQEASSSAPASASTSASPSGSASATTAKGTKVYKGLKVAGGKGETPTIIMSKDFKPVSVLHTVDLIQGSGDPVVDGSTVTVNYVGMGQQSQQVFDSSYERGEPITFPLSGVIEGWSEGLIGMQPGGRRVLIIPGDMGYGSAGQPPAIGQDETLVFVVDLLQTGTASPTP